MSSERALLASGLFLAGCTWHPELEAVDSGLQEQIDALADASATKEDLDNYALKSDLDDNATQSWVTKQDYVDTTTLDTELALTEELADVRMAAAACVANAFANGYNYGRALWVEDGMRPEDVCSAKPYNMTCYAYMDTLVSDENDAEILGSSGCSTVANYSGTRSERKIYACCRY